MNDKENELLAGEALNNRFEGKTVGYLVWPFYRYTALIPQKIGGDVFEWLYMSLCVYVNETHGWAKDNYTDVVVEEVRRLINTRFSSIIDGQTFEKIRANAQNDFVDTTASKTKATIKPNAFTFLQTYETLFADQVEQKFIFQDAITGEVVPDFDPSVYVDEAEKDEKSQAIPPRESVKRPSKNAVKKAYGLYIKLKKHSANAETVIEEEEEKGYFDPDPDAQTYFGFEEDEFEPVEEEAAAEEKPKNLDDYSVIYLDNSKVRLDSRVDVSVQNNELHFTSPFGILTDEWLTKVAAKAKNVSSELGEKIGDLQSTFLISKEERSKFILAHKNDFASHLHHAQTLYRIILPIGDERLLDYSIEIDSGLKNHDIMHVYPVFGKFLEHLLSICKYKDSSALERSNSSLQSFGADIDAKFRSHPEFSYEQYKFMKSKNIHDNWRKKYWNPNRVFTSFLADFVDFVLKSDILDSKDMYPEFLDDVFHLYNLRNSESHDNDERTEINEDELKKLEKVTRVFVDLLVGKETAL